MVSEYRVKYVGLDPVPDRRSMLWAVALFGALLFGAVIGGAGAGFTAKVTGGRVSDWVVLGSTMGSAISSLSILYVGFALKLGWGWRELGFRDPKRSLWHLLWWVPVTLVFGALGAMAVGQFFGLESSEVGSRDKSIHLGFAAEVVIVFGVAVVTPLVEEIVFRRVLLDRLNTVLPAWLATVLVTFFFTVAHVALVLMAYVFFLGLSLILARHWFESLWAPFLIHAVNNLVVILLALLAL